MKFDKIGPITPTEYARDIYIDKILSMVSGEIRSVCDVGCGVGNLLLLLEDRAIDVRGVDTSEESLRIARKRVGSSRIRLDRKDVFELDEQFDLIFLTDVLEHVRDDSRLLQFLRDKVIRRSGYLLFTVPAHSRLYSRFDKNAGHYRRYDKGDLISIVRQSGLEPVLCWSYGQLFFHYIANAMLLFQKRSHPERAGTKDEYLSEKTRTSAIREFSGITRLLVSRVNIIHHLCFWLDYLCRDINIGIAYCVLCRSR